MEAVPQVGGLPRRARIAELGPVFVGVAAAAGLTVLRMLNGEAYDRGIVPSIAFGLVVAVPALLALLARHRRPSLYLASGAAFLPASFLSFAGVTLPLLFVAAMAFVAYGRHADEEMPMVWAPLTAVVIFILTIATFAVLLFVGGDDPRCVSTPTSQSCTSDVITNGEALAALGVVALILAAGWFLSKPRGHDNAS
jgi:hypothetical protein